MKSEELLRLREENVPRGVWSATPLFAAGAEGATIVDVEGRTYIDFAGGIGVANAGHCPPAVVKAIKDQAGKFVHTCFHVVMYEPYVLLAEKLNRLTPGSFRKKTAFFNSGAEAVENSIKIARYHTGRSGVICFENAFHGRTLLGMSLTSKVMPYKKGFGPFAPEIYRMHYAYCYRCPLTLSYPDCGIACAEGIKEIFVNHVAPEQVAALIVEPVAGEGGFIVPPVEFLLRIREICREHGIVFISDEIQSGMGRTGRWYAMEHFGIEPDITLSAKSLGGGLPLSAVTGRAEIMDSVHTGGLGGTFGGNPVACRAALAVIETIEKERLLERGRRLGEKVRRAFSGFAERFEIVGDVRGLGPMTALELVRSREKKEPATEEAKELVRFSVENGLIIISCGPHSNVIRTLMPLTITDEQLDRGLEILERGLARVSGR